MPERHVVHLITSLQGGGTEHFLYEVLRHSPRDYRHDVIWLKHDGVYGERIAALGIPVHRMNSLQLFRFLQRERLAILHTLLYRAHQIGRLLGHAAGVPVVSSQRAIDRWQSAWHRLLDCLTLRWCAGVLVNSESAKTLVETRLGKLGNVLVRHVANGIDLPPTSASDRLIARQYYKIPSDALVAGSLLRLHTEKGADRIPVFAAKVLLASPRLRLLIAGVGPLEARIRRDLRALGLNSRVDLIGWEENRHRFLSALDCYWSLSREESFPQSLLEASMAGLPWIAPDIGDIADLAKQAPIGFLYPCDNTDAASQGLLTMLARLSELQNQSAAVSAQIKLHYGLSRMIEQVYSFFDELILRKEQERS